jgi:hypothetical protein
MEHRWGHRVACDVDVKLFADAAVGWGRIRDLSISGGFIETGLRIPPLSTLRLTRTVSTGNRPETHLIRAIVVRRDARGVGVEWFDEDTDSVVALLQEARGLTLQLDGGDNRRGPADGF